MKRKRYRVRKIWFGNDNARYDLNQLTEMNVSDLASFTAQRVSNVNGVKMSGRARAGLYCLVRYEIVAHAWGTTYTCGQAADIFAETNYNMSSSAMMAHAILEDAVMTGMAKRTRGPRGELEYRLDYETIAELTNVEIIPEEY